VWGPEVDLPVEGPRAWIARRPLLLCSLRPLRQGWFCDGAHIGSGLFARSGWRQAPWRCCAAALLVAIPFAMEAMASARKAWWKWWQRTSPNVEASWKAGPVEVPDCRFAHRPAVSGGPSDLFTLSFGGQRDDTPRAGAGGADDPRVLLHFSIGSMIPGCDVVAGHVHVKRPSLRCPTNEVPPCQLARRQRQSSAPQSNCSSGALSLGFVRMPRRATLETFPRRGQSQGKTCPRSESFR